MNLARVMFDDSHYPYPHPLYLPPYYYDLSVHFLLSILLAIFTKDLSRAEMWWFLG